MIFRSVFVTAIIAVCCALDASILREKCAKQKHLLTSYEKQCCLKMNFNPFAIFNPNPNVIQFTTNVVSREREKEYQMFEKQREADRKEIQKLTQDLESVVERLRKEHKNNIKNLIATQNKTSETQLRSVENHLSTCYSDLARTRESLHELSNFQTKQEGVFAVMEIELRQAKLSLLSQEMVTEKENKLEMCGKLKLNLTMCETQLRHCHSNSHETKEQWRDRYDECSAKLKMTATQLSDASSSETKMQSTVLEVRKEGVKCRSDYDILNTKTREALAAATNQETTQTQKIVSLEKEFGKCTNELAKQLVLNDQLRTQRKQQSNYTESERRAKELCQIKMKDVEVDYNDCELRREGERAVLKNCTVRAEQCAADYGDCDQQLTTISFQTQDSSQQTATELAGWKALHTKCKEWQNECLKSRTDLADKFTFLTEKHDGCEMKLEGQMKDEALCQEIRSGLEYSLKASSDADGDARTQLQAVTQQEALCQSTLTDARQAKLLCQGSTVGQQQAKEQCLKEVTQLAKQLGSLEASRVEMDDRLSDASKQTADCNRARGAATASVKSLDVAVKSCHKKITNLTITISAFKIEINHCLHARNLTLANVTEWQQLHKSCELSGQQAEKQQEALAARCEADRLDLTALQQRTDRCQKQLHQVQEERRQLLIEGHNNLASLTLLNITAKECAAQRDKMATEALRQKEAGGSTDTLLAECTAALISCQSPARACPDPVGNNSYWDLDRSVGRASGAAAAGQLVGCAMASRDKMDGGVMRHFCHKQHGNLFKVANEGDVALAYEFLHLQEGKYLVEPSAYFVSSINLDLKQYASDEEVCYFIERTAYSAPELQHGQCKDHVFSAMCWAAYEHSDESEAADNGGAAPGSDGEDYNFEYLDYSKEKLSNSDGKDDHFEYLDYSKEKNYDSDGKENPSIQENPSILYKENPSIIYQT